MGTVVAVVRPWVQILLCINTPAYVDIESVVARKNDYSVLFANVTDLEERVAPLYSQDFGFLDYCFRNLSLGLYVAPPAYHKFAIALIYDKGIGLQALCPVDNQEVSVENAHIVIAVRVHSHKNSGRRVLYIKGVEVEPYVFVALGGTWEYFKVTKIIKWNTVYLFFSLFYTFGRD